MKFHAQTDHSRKVTLKARIGIFLAFGTLVCALFVFSSHIRRNRIHDANNQKATKFLKRDSHFATGKSIDSLSSKVEDTSHSITSALPRQIRTLSEQAVVSEDRAVSAILGDGSGAVRNRVGKLQDIRGAGFSEEDQKRSMDFLRGNSWPSGIGKGECHWLADELLTNLRMQEPPREKLATELAEVAFRSNTDPVIRDYIMQHLGHLWEQYGAREEIEAALWQGVDTTDNTTPGTALIALNRGYERDQRDEKLAGVWQKALALAQDPNASLAVKVTALSIAGESSDKKVKEFAATLAKNPETPVILLKVAEQVAGGK